MPNKSNIKYGSEVYIFADLENGLPHIYKGRVVGFYRSLRAAKETNFYVIEAGLYEYTRTRDAIFESVDEMKDFLKDLVVE